MSKIYLIKKSALSFARASSAFEMWILEWNAIGEYRGWREYVSGYLIVAADWNIGLNFEFFWCAPSE